MKRQLAALLLTIFALSLTACGETAGESETRTVYAMDTVMNLTVYGENAAAVLESAEKELHTLDEAVLSRTAEGSELYALNASNGETVECGADVLKSERSFDFALVCEFENLESFKAYKTHPVHLPVKEYMHTVVESSKSCDFIE